MRAVAASPIARVVAARSLNTFGRAVMSATVLWELWDRTHDKLLIAAIGVVQIVPVIALFIPVGALVDRIDRRLLSTVAAALAGAVGLGLAAASFMGAPIAIYLGLLLAWGAVNAVHAPASSSLLPMIIARADLVRTNQIGSSLQELAAISGPALAGLALAVVEPSLVYAAIAATALASASLYRALPQPRAIGGEVATAPATAAAANRRDWRVGLRFIARTPLLASALTLDMFAVLFAGVTALLPAIATDVLHVGPIGFGVLRASQSAGAVAMAIAAQRMRPWRRPGRVLLIVVALFGLATVAFGLSTSFPLSVALLFACGALDNVSVVIRLTLEQMVVPDAIRGRVSAVHFVFIGMSNELGAAESGLAAWLVGTVPAIVAGGAVAALVVGVVALRWPALAAMPPLAELEPSDPG